MRRATGSAVKVAAALVVGGLLSLALATTYRQLGLAALLDAAEIAFSGTVASTRVEMRDDLPWTIVAFDVGRLMAGELEEGRVELAFLGGERTAGGALTVSLMPRFAAGEEVLVLAYADEYYSPLVGFNQGLWRLRDGAWVDETGRTLTLDPEGRLEFGEEAVVSADEVVEALERELEARE